MFYGGQNIEQESRLRVRLVADGVYTKNAVVGERNAVFSKWVAIGFLHRAVRGPAKVQDAGLVIFDLLKVLVKRLKVERAHILIRGGETKAVWIGFCGCAKDFFTWDCPTFGLENQKTHILWGFKRPTARYS